MHTRAKETEPRIFDPSMCAVFWKTREKWGGLSNMSGGFPLVVNATRIRTTEALYQACRFPFNPTAQKAIIAQTSPIAAKMVSKKHRHETRSDWFSIRVDVMRWVNRVKLAQHPETFGLLLLSTGQDPIVERSSRDAFWGATVQTDGSLKGINRLGSVLSDIRQELREGKNLQVVPPLTVPDFLLFGDPITFATNTGVT